MSEYRLQAPLEKPELRGAWTFIRIPFNVAEEFGVKGQVAVKGTINGIPYESSLLPQGDGVHILVVNKELRDRAGVATGDLADVVLERTTEPRQVTTPPELAAALQAQPEAAEVFQSLSYSHRKAYCDHVAKAKREDTRWRRATKCVDLLLEAVAGGYAPGFRRSPS